jgi:hypothetical protein
MYFGVVVHFRVCILSDLNQSQIFSKLDIKWAYHQIELDPGAREITTFQSHKGDFRQEINVWNFVCA